MESSQTYSRLSPEGLQLSELFKTLCVKGQSLRNFQINPLIIEADLASYDSKMRFVLVFFNFGRFIWRALDTLALVSQALDALALDALSLDALSLDAPSLPRRSPTAVPSTRSHPPATSPLNSV